MVKKKKKKEMVKVKALTYIIYNGIEYSKGEEFQIEKEYSNSMIKNKSIEVLEEVEEIDEDNQEGDSPEGGE